jgi:aminotransferase
MAITKFMEEEMSNENKDMLEKILSKRALEIGATFPTRQTSVPTEGLITMSGGTPDFPTPPHVVEAGCKAIQDGHTTYTPWPGIMPLREAIAKKLLEENDLDVDPGSEILVTAGSQGAMLTVMMSLVDEGDEMIIPAPFYGEYRRDMIMAGGKLVPIKTEPENSFEIDPDKLEAAITSQTKGIILVTPSNPTGGIIRRPTLERIAAIAREHDLYVISDELYERFIFDDFEHVSIASFPGMWERTVTLNSFSKCYGMTGWRVGYTVAHEALIKAMLPIHHNMSICAPSVSQWAAVAALEGPHDWFDEVLEDYDRRRHAWMEGLDEMGLPYGYPQGAYYVMFDVTPTGLSSQEFANEMRGEANVVVGGGGGATNPFNEGYNRGSLVTPLEELKEGLDRMKPVVARLTAALKTSKE